MCGCTEFHGQQMRSTVVLNPAEKSAAVVEDEDSDLNGPVVRQPPRRPSALLDAPIVLMVLTAVTRCRSTGAACVVTKKGWFITPGRCDQQMKAKPSSSLAFTAGDRQHHTGCVLIAVVV